MNRLVFSFVFISVIFCQFAFSQTPSGGTTNCKGIITSFTSTGACRGDSLKLKMENASRVDWQLNGTTIIKDSILTVINPTIQTVAGGNGKGSGMSQFDKPSGVFVDALGNVYVSEVYNYRIQKWAPGATSGTTVAGGNGQGGGNNQLTNPVGLFVDALGNVYVCDQGNNRIQKWVPGSTYAITVAGGNGKGSGINQLDSPGGVFVDASGNVYISDRFNNRIQKWAPGSTFGITVAGANGAGSNSNQLYYPTGVFVDSSGNLYVSDYFNNRIQKWTLGASSGITVAGGNGAGSNANQLKAPQGVYVDAVGNVYIPDVENNRIQKWAPLETYGITVAGGNGYGSDSNQFAFANSVWLDAFGNIYVCDQENNRIQKWTTNYTASYKVAQSGAYTALVTSSVGCSTSTDTLSIHSSPPIGVAGNTMVCKAGTATLSANSAATNPVYRWYDSPTDGTLLFTGATYTTGAVTKNTTFYVALSSSSSSCPSVPRISQIVSVRDTNTWIGALDGQWSVGTNWLCGNVPTSTQNVNIPNGASVIISDTTHAVANNLKIDAAGQLTIANTGTLTVNGTWTNAGTFVHNSGTVIIDGKIIPTKVITQNLERNFDGINIQIFPNPTLNNLTITASAQAGNLQSIKVYSVQGMLLLKTIVEGSQTSVMEEIASFPQGMYLVEVISDRSKYYKNILKE